MKTSVFRVDKFSVPDHARRQFLEKVHATHDLLRTQAGFLQDVILEQASGLGEFNVATIVERVNAETLEPARKAIAALHERMNFDPSEMLTRLGILADIGNYKLVDTSNPYN